MTSLAVGTPVRELNSNEANSLTPTNSAQRQQSATPSGGNNINKSPSAAAHVVTSSASKVLAAAAALQNSAQKQQQQQHKEPKRLSASPPPFIPASMQTQGGQLSPVQPPYMQGGQQQGGNNMFQQQQQQLMMMQNLLAMQQMMSAQQQQQQGGNNNNNMMPPLPPQHHDVNECMCPTCQYYRAAMILHQTSASPQMQMQMQLMMAASGMMPQQQQQQQQQQMMMNMMMLQQQQQQQAAAMNNNNNNNSSMTPSRQNNAGGNSNSAKKNNNNSSSSATKSPSYGHHHSTSSASVSPSASRSMLHSSHQQQSPSPSFPNNFNNNNNNINNNNAMLLPNAANLHFDGDHNQQQQQLLPQTLFPAATMNFPNPSTAPMPNFFGYSNNNQQQQQHHHGNSLSPSPRQNSQNSNSSSNNSNHHHMNPNEALNQFRSASGHLAQAACTSGGRQMIQTVLRAQLPDVVGTLLNEVIADLESVAVDAHGCHVLRNLIEVLNESQAELLCTSMSERAILAISTTSQHTRRILQSLFERHHTASATHLQHAVDLLAKNSLYLSQTQQGCIALMRVFERCNDAQKHLLVEPLLAKFAKLAVDPFGNYVVQCVLVNSNPVTRAQYIEQGLKGSFVELACNKFSSNVLEKVVRHATTPVRSSIVAELVMVEEALETVAADQFGNFVLQTLVETSVQSDEFEEVSQRVRAVLPKTAFARKLEAKLKHANKIVTSSASRAGIVSSTSPIRN